MHCNQICLHLYSRACLYKRSLIGVNSFCSSSVMDWIQQPSNASLCVIAWSALTVGTGRGPSKQWRSLKPAPPGHPWTCWLPLPWWLNPVYQKNSSSSRQGSLLSPLLLFWSAGGCWASGTSMFASQWSHSTPWNPVIRYQKQKQLCTRTYQVHTLMTKVRTSTYSVQLCPKLCPWYQYIPSTYMYILVCTEYILRYNYIPSTYLYIQVWTEYVRSTYSVQGYCVAVTLKSCYSVYFGVQILCILGMAHGCIGTPHAIVQDCFVLLCTGTVVHTSL